MSNVFQFSAACWLLAPLDLLLNFAIWPLGILAIWIPLERLRFFVSDLETAKKRLDADSAADLFVRWTALAVLCLLFWGMIFGWHDWTNTVCSSVLEASYPSTTSLWRLLLHYPLQILNAYLGVAGYLLPTPTVEILTYSAEQHPILYWNTWGFRKIAQFVLIGGQFAIVSMAIRARWWPRRGAGAARRGAGAARRGAGAARRGAGADSSPGGPPHFD